MHFIRFLKVPLVTLTKQKGHRNPTITVIVTTLITVVTDLGESFLDRDVQLRISLRANVPGRTLLASKTIDWKGGWRSAPAQLIFSQPLEGDIAAGVFCVSSVTDRA